MTVSDGAALPRSVLFACGQNAVRSPMAAAIARALLPEDVEVRSAGISAGMPDPFVRAVLAEIGLEAPDEAPRQLDEIAPGSFDLLIVLCGEARADAASFAGHVGVPVEFWPTDDPTVTEGSREQVLTAYRAVRDGLMRRLEGRFGRSRQESG